LQTKHTNELIRGKHRIHERDEVLCSPRMELSAAIVRQHLHRSSTGLEQRLKLGLVLRFLMELDIASEVHTGVWCPESKIGVDTLPVVVEEFIGDVGLLVEEDERAEVGLLVRAGAEAELIEVVCGGDLLANVAIKLARH
jgi:hypothetical protein